MPKATGNPRGRPAVKWVEFTCCNPDCKEGDDGKPAVVTRTPSAAKKITHPEWVFCSTCRPLFGTKPTSRPVLLCERCGKPLNKHAKRWHAECFEVVRAAQVKTPCKRCGHVIEAAASRARKLCGPNDNPDCWALSRFKNLTDPIRWVNGKPVRYHSDLKHTMVWNPARGPKGQWMLEHRYLYEQKHGVQLDPNQIVHHIDEVCDSNGDVGNFSLESNTSHSRRHAELLKARLAKLAEYERRYGPLSDDDGPTDVPAGI